MPAISVTWVLPDGNSRTADVQEGHNLMEAAVANGIAGISGDCGGALACATCHVAVLEGSESAKTCGEMEDDMLDMVDGERSETSRLSCQLIASSDLDGIVLRIP